MNAEALQIFAMASKYTDDSIDGYGVQRGRNCQIASREAIEGGTRVTFAWYDDEDNVRLTAYIDVMNGKDGKDGQGEKGDDGRGIKRSYVNPEGHVIVVYDDDTTDDWGKLTVIESSGATTEDITVSVNCGGYKSGDTIPTGTSFEKIFQDMLNPVAYPTLTNPSASLTATGTKLLEVGATLSTTFTLTLNRGSINPRYTAESSYRSGEATGYVLNGGESQATNTFNVIVTSAQTSYQGTVSYGAGVQPKDSVGKNYSSPLPAGSVNSNVINYEFVNALYANTSNIGTVTKLSLVSKSAKTKTFEFPAQTASNPEEFHIPTSWNVTSVKVLNTLSNQWEDCSAEFTVTDTTHVDAGGNETNYKKYLCNLGYGTGARQIRVTWS